MSELSEAERTLREATARVGEAITRAVEEFTSAEGKETDEKPTSFWKKTHETIERYVEALRAASLAGVRAVSDDSSWRFTKKFAQVLDSVLEATPETVRAFRERNPDVVGPIAGAGTWLLEPLGKIEPMSYLTAPPEFKYGVFMEALLRQPDWKSPPGLSYAC